MSQQKSMFENLQIFNINTDSSQQTQSHFTFNIDKPVKRLNKISLQEVQFPRSVYNVNSLNNTFSVQRAGELAPGVITIPEGTYTNTQFSVALTAELEAAFDGEWGPGSVGVQAGTYKLQFLPTSDDEYTFSNMHPTMQNAFGTIEPQFTVSKAQPLAPGIFNLSNVFDQVYIACNQVDNINTGAIGRNDILGTIYMSTTPFLQYEIQSFDIEQHARNFINNSRQIQIQILTKNGEALTKQLLNNVEAQFQIAVWYEEF